MVRENWLGGIKWLGMVGFVLGTGYLAHAQAKDPAEKPIAVPEGRIIFFVGDGDKDQPKEAGKGTIILQGTSGTEKGQQQNKGIIVIKEGGEKEGAVKGEAKLAPKNKEGTIQLEFKGTPGMPFTITGTAQIEASPYFVGLQCNEVTDAALRAQLNLPKGKGLIVESVVADSPAAKAGFKEHDILLRAGEKELATLADLVAAVDAAKESELKVVVLRGGQKTGLTVNPQKRQSAPQADVLKFVPAQDAQVIKKWTEGLTGESKEGDGNIHFRAIAPGVAVGPARSWMAHDLPDDMSVSVTYNGKKPMAIVVKQGDQTWEATDETVEKLPEKVQGYVGPLVGRWDLLRFRYNEKPVVRPFTQPFTLKLGPDGKVENAEFGPGKPEGKPEAKPAEKGERVEKGDAKRPAVDAAMDKRLDELQRKMDELNSALRELRDPKKRAEDRPEKTKAKN